VSSWIKVRCLTQKFVATGLFKNCTDCFLKKCCYSAIQIIILFFQQIDRFATLYGVQEPRTVYLLTLGLIRWQPAHLTDEDRIQLYQDAVDLGRKLGAVNF
jgi:hypothetical protein